MATAAKTVKPKKNPVPRQRVKGTKRDTPQARVERSDNAAGGAQSAGHAQLVSTSMRRVNRLKTYLDPHSEEMADVIMGIARNRKVHASIRLEAASRILDRIYGKPKETLEVTDPHADTPQDEVLGLLNNILENVGAQRIGE